MEVLRVDQRFGSRSVKPACLLQVDERKFSTRQEIAIHLYVCQWNSSDEYKNVTYSSSVSPLALRPYIIGKGKTYGSIITSSITGDLGQQQNQIDRDYSPIRKPPSIPPRQRGIHGDRNITRRHLHSLHNTSVV